MDKKQKLKKLEDELIKLRNLNKSSWDSYGSELCSGEMEKNENKLEEKIKQLKNEIVKEFFISNGAYPDFEIINSPMFEIEQNGKTRTLMVGTMNTNIHDFINKDLNNLNRKSYIYNNGDIDIFNKNMKSIRFTQLDCDDRLMKYRKNKINIIKQKLDDK